MDSAHKKKQFPAVESALRSTGFGPSFQPADVRVVQIHREGSDTCREASEWILIEQRQDIEYDATGRTAHRAALCVHYWDLDADPADKDMPNGEFRATYDSFANAVSITSGAVHQGGYVIIQPTRLRGLGLGTYLMNLVVTWAKQWPHAEVCAISLLAGNAGNADNLARRNRFYRQFGIEFDFLPGQEEIAGTSRPMTAGQLICQDLAPAITEHALVLELRRRMDDARTASTDQRGLQRALREANSELADAYAHPIRWMCKRLLLDAPVRSAFTVAAMVALALAWRHLP